MASAPPDLEALRRRIDEIDDRLHELVIERAEVVSLVAASKKQGGNLSAYQPGREAEILRRRAARHRGDFPLASLLRIWREMLAATVRLQSPFPVAVFAPPDMPGFWDLARDHYGSHALIMPYRSVGQVIRAVGTAEAAVGVLPQPQEVDPDPWWRHLVSSDERAPRIVARLPFGARGNARTDGAEALVIGRAAAQPTGADRTFLAAETAAEISRGRIFALLAEAGLDCTFLGSCEQDSGTLHLIEIDGFVAVADPRLDGLRARLGGAPDALVPLGLYARPLPASLFAPAAGVGGGALPAGAGEG